MLSQKKNISSQQIFSFKNEKILYHIKHPNQKFFSFIIMIQIMFMQRRIYVRGLLINWIYYRDFYEELLNTITNK
ncbi:unnamed protein product [Paramecium sonneborni]|uniref:Uncharacterized protein n=1 Tax=Paramecium sonneborni TaxID=65129 RepID=A0A8S1N048_9CILI|nr:unnamed protein product [Paramecium sonneborni]